MISGHAEGEAARRSSIPREAALAVRVNGEARDVPPGTTVEDVVCEVAPERRGIAVALTGVVVPRSAWSATVLAAGDQVEILSAAQGG